MISTLQRRESEPCPLCGGETVYEADDTLVCTLCGNALEISAEPTPPQTPKRKKKEAPTIDPRPEVPKGANIRDVVLDYYSPTHDGENLMLCSRVYCPKVNGKDDSEFDPNSPYAQFYLHVHAKRFKNRRRYDRDIKRRRGGLPSPKSASITE